MKKDFVTITENLKEAERRGSIVIMDFTPLALALIAARDLAEACAEVLSATAGKKRAPRAWGLVAARLSDFRRADHHGEKK